MALYRLYIDEVGNHDMNHVDGPNERFLSLTGVIIESYYCKKYLIPEMDKIKQMFFQRDPDEPIIFHRKDMINRRPPFEALRSPEIENRFNAVLLGKLRDWDYKVISVTIDKQAHKNQYLTWLYHPYHYCMSVMLERFVLYLHYGGHRGDVMVESRGGVEDRKLKDSYQRLFINGTENISHNIWQECLTSQELKVKPKSANVTGLQIADIIAHPSRREILLGSGLCGDSREIFGDKIIELLNESKYLRNQTTGKIEGYGKKLLP